MGYKLHTRFNLKRPLIIYYIHISASNNSGLLSSGGTHFPKTYIDCKALYGEIINISFMLTNERLALMLKKLYSAIVFNVVVSVILCMQSLFR